MQPVSPPHMMRRPQSVRRFMARLPRAKVDVVAGGYHDILSAGRLQRDCVDAMISWLS